MAFNQNANTHPSLNNLFDPPVKTPINPNYHQIPVGQAGLPNAPSQIQNRPNLPNAPSLPSVRPNFPNIPNIPSRPSINPNGFSNVPMMPPAGTPSPVTRPPFSLDSIQNNVSVNSSRNSSPALNYLGHSDSPIPQHQHPNLNTSLPRSVFGTDSSSLTDLKNAPSRPSPLTLPPSRDGLSNPPHITQSSSTHHSQPSINPPSVPNASLSHPSHPSSVPSNAYASQNWISSSNMPPVTLVPNVPYSTTGPAVNQTSRPPYQHQRPIAPPIPQASSTNYPDQSIICNQPRMNTFGSSTSSTNTDIENKDSINSKSSSIPFPSQQINSTMPPLIPAQSVHMPNTNAPLVPPLPVTANRQYPKPPQSTSFPAQSSHGINNQMNPNNQNQPVNPSFHQPHPPPLNTVPMHTSVDQVQSHITPNQHYSNMHQNTTQYASNHYNGQQDLSQQMGRMNIHQTGFNKLWGHETVDLLQCRNILPEGKIEPPVIKLNNQFANSANCSPEIFRCTLTKIPDTNSLLQKCRLPLGILIHPFKDLTHLPVIQCNSIVRCRSCRTYINPFVYFIDLKRWKCNLCYRVNDLPEEFQYDPVTKSYGDPTRRPEIQSATIEYIAPSEYMLRPPQPAAYLFLFDVSSTAAESGYLKICCETLIEQIDNLPGDSRTQLAFICYDSAIHFYFLGECASRPKEMTVIDIDDVFLPSPEDLMVNLAERRTAILELLAALPERYKNPSPAATQSALGAALQAAHKLMAPTGGRITVFQTCLANIGPGALTAREDPNNRSSKDVAHLNPATDFYKRQALNCSGVQIAVDLFLLNSQYADLSTLSGISRFSGGTVYHIPLFKASREWQAQELKRCLVRYFTRKIGFEAVMRVRCTRGLSIHTFHGSFFVRSTDLLSLPNISPDVGFGMQLAIEESLSDVQHVCFQAALLYTSSKGERRIRVHTLCLPVSGILTDIVHSADQQCIVGLLAKMAVDRSQSSSLSDAREALVNASVDALGTVKIVSGPSHGLMCPMALRLFPLYLLSLLKHTSFRTGTSTRLDDRVAAMCDMKSLPLGNLLRNIYPDLYPVHRLSDNLQSVSDERSNEVAIPNPPRLRLSAEKVNATGAYLLDHETSMILYIGHTINPIWLQNTLGIDHHNQIPDDLHSIPTLETEENVLLHTFIDHLNDEKPFPATLHIVRDNSPNRTLFIEKLVDDRIDGSLSYYEFLQHVKSQMK